METKICSQCKKEKLISQFFYRKPSKDGHSAYCKECYKKYDKVRYYRYKEKRLAKDYKRYLEKKDIILKQNKEYYRKNKDKIYERHKRYKEKRRDDYKKWHKNWRIKNPKKLSFWSGQHQTRKKNAIGSYTFREWELLKKQYSYTCPRCGKKEPEIKLSQDHIKSLNKGGTNYINNIQPLCLRCNSFKNDRFTKKYKQK